jgi:chemotaxis protein MotA
VDWASLVGFILVVVGISSGQLMEGGRLSSLVQPAAFVIVAIGTLGAVLLQSRMSTFRRGLRMLKWVISEPQDNSRKNIQDALIWSAVARREGF